MSRVGKKPVPVPSGVTATVDGQMVKAVSYTHLTLPTKA